MAGILIRVFLAEGTPEGLRTFEVSNQTVHATVFPRPALDRFLKRRHAGRPGVYMLVGRDLERDETRVYVGEGDPTGDRLRSHGSNEGFEWTQAIVFTSKDDYLTKTQIQFLESRLVGEMKAAGRVDPRNVQRPGEPSISEADQAEVEGFLDQVRLLLGAAGFNFLRSRVAREAPSSPSRDAFVYRIKAAEARLIRTANSYTVLQGSTALAVPRPSAEQWNRKLREELVAAGILIPSGAELLRFAKDAEFESASAAASVVAGGNANGRVFFKRESDGRTLGEVEEAEAQSMHETD